MARTNSSTLDLELIANVLNAAAANTDDHDFELKPVYADLARYTTGDCLPRPLFRRAERFDEAGRCVIPSDRKVDDRDRTVLPRPRAARISGLSRRVFLFTGNARTHLSIRIDWQTTS